MKIERITETLCTEWWKWILSIPRERNPLYDSYGRNSKFGYRKGKDMWFLAGTTEHIDGSAMRRCTIPKGKAILIPLMNVIATKDENLDTVDKLEQICKDSIDELVGLKASVDEKKLTNLENYRVLTEPFEVRVRANNFLSLHAGSHIAVSDGYWVLLKDTITGDHTIRFRGTSLKPGHEFDQDVKYHITIT